ncbi:MAG TPA: protein kinase [Opitutaceae bacterium]|nr:protein kinase [Opitutaceae bacterium]
MNTEAQREEDLFDAARRLTNPRERRDYLERACDGDTALRARIEALLTAQREAERFFDAGGEAVRGVEGQAELSPAPADGAAAGPLPCEEQVGARVGRYRLLQKIGEGGCGVVYMAEQQEPVRRRVALKIIKLGMETRSVIARFEAERQALAMMDHPNIARVFDAGATERGSPYFVMELVRGARITDYCDHHRLSIAGRLHLFVQVCNAIQHAHQKGIIHGDIKPSNIMVTLHDGAPVPKVIDFGISKATEARLTDKVLFTAYAQLVGTPTYMSPEQAEMSGLDIDTRSDIYSLGVLLYELLTGRTPFDAKALVAGGLDEMRRTLREKEPPRPSARLRALEPDALTSAAQGRQAEPSRLIASLHGDLDWIVMKALEKDRGRRYETANGLAMDIHRHLNHDPVIACPPSRLYRFSKLVRRNRGVFAAGAAVAVTLVVGTGTSTWLLLKERDARQRAVAAEQQQARLRHQAETREKISQAALLVSQERFDEADSLLRDINFSQPTVEGAAVLRSLGEWHAVQGRWKAAADRFVALLRVNQADGWDTATLDCLRCGPVLIELGDTTAYERFRQDVVMRYGGTSCPAADRILKICLLLPAGARGTAALASVAEDTLKSLRSAEAANDIFQAAWLSLSLALWEYRSANYAKSVEWCQRCLAYPELNAPRAVTAHVILALCYRQLGRGDDARRELAGSRDVIVGKFRGRIDRGTPVQGFWFDWFFARILWREASAALVAADPNDDGPE